MGDEAPDAPAADAPRLSAQDIASREFGRASDGLAEDEVRAFLREVADAYAKVDARARELEARVNDLDARFRVPGSTAPGIGAPDPRAEELFARLREADVEAPAPEPAAEAPPEPEPPPVAEAPAAEVPEEEREVEAPAEPEPEEPTPPTEGDRLRARRDGLIATVVPDLLRSSKRLLQDEQNLLLDGARRARGRIDVDRLLPEPVRHRDAWAALLGPALETAYAGGRSRGARARRAAAPPERVLHELTATVLMPLRDRLKSTIKSVVAEGPYESSAELHRALASAIGARYREWRSSELETRLVDALAAAFARGAYDGAPSGARLRWVTDAPGRCPDCDDNALEATVKGRSFPTGQTHPPAHPGCRCLVMPVGGDTD